MLRAAIVQNVVRLLNLLVLLRRHMTFKLQHVALIQPHMFGPERGGGATRTNAEILIRDDEPTNRNPPVCRH